MPILLLLYTFNYMDRSNIAYAQLGMGQDLGISVATFGTVAGILFIGYVIFEIPSNMMMKLLGARFWLSRIAISWGVIAVLTAFVSNVTQLYLVRVLLGIAEAGLYPGLMLYIVLWFRSKDRVRAVAALTACQPVALIVGSLTGGWILDNIHWLTLHSWQWLFILQGAPSILIGAIAYRYLPSKPDEARFLTEEEVSWLQSEISKDYDPHEQQVSFLGQLRAIRNIKLIHLATANFLIGCGLYGLTFFLPLILKQVDPTYSSTEIGLLGAIPYLLAAPSLLLVAANSDRTGNHKAHVMVLAIVAALGLFGVIQFAAVPTLSLACLALAAIGVFGALSPVWGIAARMLSREHNAVGLATVNTLSLVSGFVAPVAIGMIVSESDVIVGLYFPITCLVIAAAMLYFLRVPAANATRASTVSASAPEASP